MFGRSVLLVDQTAFKIPDFESEMRAMQRMLAEECVHNDNNNSGYTSPESYVLVGK